MSFNISIKNYDNFHRNAIHYAAMGSNNFALQTLWMHGVPFDIVDCVGMTPLMYAAKTDSFDNFSLLLEAGANTDVEINNCKLITLCAEGGSQYSIQRMLELGQNIEEQSPYGTPLIVAGRNNKTEAVEFLILNGANINIKDEKYNSILHYAAYYSNLYLIKLEVEHGLNLNDFNIAKETPLLYALQQCDTEVIKFMMQNGAKEEYIHDSIITTAIKKNKKDLISIAKEIGLNVNKPDLSGYSALHWAVQLKDIELIDMLIEIGCNIDITNNEGMTPLQQAIKSKEANIAKHLIEKGANIDKQDRYGNTPLHECANSENYEIAEYLLQKGANPNIKNKDLKTPLVLAAINSNYHLVKLFLDNGADPNITGRNGMTALYYVRSNQRISALLNSKGCTQPIIKQTK